MRSIPVISIIIFMLLFSARSEIAFAQPEIEHGVLDLRNYSFEKNGILEIKGDAAFFWEKIVDPILDIDSADYYIPIVSAWKDQESLVPGILPKGFASYRVKILVPPRLERVAFRFTEVFSASGYYVNGKSIGYNGFPGTNRFQTVFKSSPSLHLVTVRDSVMDLVIHVSNFEHRSGGIRGSISMGTPMQIMEAKANRQFRDYFLMGAFLIIGLFFISLFLIRTELYRLYFAIICLLMAFRIFILSDSETLQSSWISGVSRLRLEYLSFDMLVPFFLLMVRALFPYEFNKRVFLFLFTISGLMVFIVVFSSVSLFSATLPFYMIFIVIAILVLITVVIKAWIRGRSFAPGFTIGFVIVAIGAINDLLNISDVIDTGFISHFTMFTYLLIYAIIFSKKSQQMYIRAEMLSNEISSMNENLERIVAERTRELQNKSEELFRHQDEIERSNQELQKLVKMRDRFITVIGHDIRGPLGSSVQILELLQSDQIAEEEKSDMLKMVSDTSEATLNLLENLLLWGKAQTGDLQARKSSFILLDIVGETLQLFELSASKKNISIENSVPANIMVYADPEQLKLLIRNLVSNAVKFTNSGGKVKIIAKAGSNEKEVLVQIEDTGVGIPTSNLERLFDEHDLFSTFGTNREPGSGIGLRLCKELVELNGGTIKVESRTGQGTVFTVVFPSVKNSD